MPYCFSATKNHLIKYKKLFENAPIGQILVKSKEIILVNETFAHMYGYSSQEELIGKNVNLIQPKRLHTEFDGLGESKELGENVKTNYKLISKIRSEKLSNMHLNAVSVLSRSLMYRVMLLPGSLHIRNLAADRNRKG